MARAYSDDLRRRVVEAVEGGASCRVAAARYQVSVSFVVKLMQRWRSAATVTAKPVGGQRPYRLAGRAELVRWPGARIWTLEELRGDLAKHGVQVGRSSVDRFLNKLGLTRKKRRSMPASRAAPMLPEPEQPGAPHSQT